MKCRQPAEDGEGMRHNTQEVEQGHEANWNHRRRVISMR